MTLQPFFSTYLMSDSALAVDQVWSLDYDRPAGSADRTTHTCV